MEPWFERLYSIPAKSPADYYAIMQRVDNRKIEEC